MPVTVHEESALLTALIDNPASMMEAANLITPECFSDPGARAVWKALTDLYAAGEEISLIAVLQRTRGEFVTNHILTSLAGQLPGREVTQRIAALYNASLCRLNYERGMRIVQSASRGVDIEGQVSLAEDIVKGADAAVGRRPVSMHDALTGLEDRIQRIREKRMGGKRTRVSSSFEDIDWVTYGGFAPGNLVILAARPSVGKTAIALQMARHAAMGGIPATFVSLEMSADELAQRMVVSTGKVESWAVSRAEIDPLEFADASNGIAQIPLWIDEYARSIDDIEIRLAQAHNQGHADVAYIDYLGLISSKGDNRTLYQQVTDNTRRLKLLARDLEIPIVLLCQLNRDSARCGRAPEMYDLRESGSIEQDADIIMLLHAPRNDERIGINVAKNRQGKKDIWTMLDHDEAYTRFWKSDNQTEFDR